jgi:alanine racemase
VTPTALAVIDPGALRHNLEVIRRSSGGCRVLAVIKANAYGHGLVQVARVLAAADALAVARLDEALQLRAAGVASRIVVLGGFVTAAEARLAGSQALEVVVHSPAQAEILRQLGAGGPVNLWLKVDTGMGRLGIDPAQCAAVAAALRGYLDRRGTLTLMTHLACADEPGSAATVEQLRQFALLARTWAGDVSIANSAGILAWPEACAVPLSAAGNWVRPGLMLYGASPLAARAAGDLGLRPAMTFETRLIAVRELRAGSRVGYGGDWVAERDSLIAVAAAGYADGYPWHRSRGTPVLVNGRRAAVVGRVSMDMISIDVTGMVAAPGDRVVLWGEGLPVEEVARAAGTIPYELLAAISLRVTRQLRD